MAEGNDELAIPEITDEELVSPDYRKRLTDREKRFVLEYCLTLHRANSAIVAGFTEDPTSARTMGAKLYAKANIRRAIRREFDRRAKKNRMTTEKMVALAETSLRRCVDSDNESGFCNALELIGKLLGMFAKDNNSKSMKVLMMNGVESNHELESIRERLRQRGVKIDEMKPKQLEGKPSNT